MKAKIYVAGLLLALGCAGCTQRHVELSYFNLSNHEIWVTDVVGVPEDAPPGRLTPVPDEERLSENSSYYFQTVRIADKLRIVWREGGQQVSAADKSASKGFLHAVELTREQVGVPAKVKDGEVRLTYLGKGRWFGTYFED